MYGRRWIGFALAALLIVVVISAVSGSAQRDAWMQGYMAGRLSTGTDGAASLAPYMMPGSPLAPSYGGFGHGGGLFVGLGLLALGFFFVTRGFGRHRGWRRGKAEWAERMHQEMRRWHEQNGDPWQPAPGEGDEQRMV
jgi:hypothetical protein